MRVLIPANLFYPSSLGGPANAVYWLARGLVSKGHKVKVVSTTHSVDLQSNGITPNTWTDLNGVDVIYNTSRHVKFSWRVIRESLKLVSASDCVLLGSIFYFPLLPIALWAKIKGKKIIWSPRGELFAPAIGGSVVKRTYVRLIKALLGRYATFHATSNEEKETIVKHFSGKAKVAVLSNLMILPPKRERRDNKKPYLLYMGRISSIKAIDNLIQGLSKSDIFLSSNIELRLYGQSDDEYKEKLVKLIESLPMLGGKIKFMGIVLGNEKFQIYADAMATILPSHSENFGNVVLESLSQATPVIASKGTPWQSLNVNNAGMWVSNDPQTLGLAIDSFLKLTPQERTNMQNNALNLSREFDVYTNIEQWTKTLHS